MEMKGKERKKSRKEAKEVTNEGGKERQSVARDERTDGRKAKRWRAQGRCSCYTVIKASASWECS
ncbi:hypothetical protein V1478_010376 [Vespula squamosa]|uniref:Uncharacterized protein n=1 Tax=Vespula squamosa TaxID=30214 RepID=A0ABD2AKA6_VESSQ